MQSKIKPILHHPIWIYLLLLVSLLPNFVAAPFFTKGEPREALVACSMLEDNNYILPTAYADEVAYKPPLFHWLVSGVSALSGGNVNEMSARFPSVIAFLASLILIYFFVLKFDGRKQVAIGTLLIYASCFEVHRNASLARVDMLLASLIVAALIVAFLYLSQPQLPKWPWSFSILLVLGVLTKGPVAIAIPLIVFCLFAQLYNKVALRDLVLFLTRTLLITVPLSLIWYVFAGMEGGSNFLNIIYAENIGRFLSEHDLKIHYNLGHEKPFYYSFIYMAYGLLPWVFIFFEMSYRYLFKEKIMQRNLADVKVRRLRIYSMLCTLFILLFYSIPASKRSVYLLPLYPFAAYLISDFCFSSNSKLSQRITQITTYVLSSLTILFTLLLYLNPKALSHLTSSQDFQLFQAGLQEHPFYWIFLLLLILSATVFSIFSYRKRKKTAQIIAANAICFLGIYCLVEGPLMSEYRNYHCAKDLVEEIEGKNIAKDDGQQYVLSDLLGGYRNLYGPAYYSRIRFKKFIPEESEGTLWCWDGDIEKIREAYEQTYQITELYRSKRDIKEGGVLVLLKLQKNNRPKP